MKSLKNILMKGVLAKKASVMIVGAAFVFCGTVSAAQTASDDSSLVLQDLDYTDHMETLPNYDRGFYTPQVLHIKPSGTVPIEKPYGKLLHLRADISEFSSSAWMGVNSATGDTIRGQSQDLTEDALDVLQKTFDNIRNFGGKTIVRICYDPWYNGHSNTTPSHDWVLRHVKQLAPVLSKNTDVIVALEMGMHGAYGEMHSDTAITYQRVAEAVNLMLQNTPPELKILTRTGNYSAAVLGFEKWGVDFNIHSDVFKKIAEAKGDTMYRVGMFNDGYLGTQFDYGTWGADCASSICREEGVAWLEKYSINTPYGGEALTTASGYQVINTPEFLAYEGFRTHTSYLNIQWNNNLIDSWKKSHFTKSDYEYDGSKIDSLTGFKYIQDHLGYRFVLRESWLPDTVYADDSLRVKLKIQNVGFGNLTASVPVKINFIEVVCDGCDVCPQEESVMLENVDFRKVHSRTIQINDNDTTMTFDGTNEIEFNVKPVILNSGIYEVYLQVGDIKFANKSQIGYSCAENNHGIYLGSFHNETSKREIESIEKKSLFSSVEEKRAWIPRVERANQKIQIRDRRNVNGIRNDDKLYRINGTLK